MCREYILQESSTLETKNHNICINPLQLLRAWALLFTFACGKTRKAMDGFLRNITSNLLGKDESIHEVLSALNAPLTECAQCIQIFCDQQPAVPVNGNVLQEIKRFYGSAVIFKAIAFFAHIQNDQSSLLGLEVYTAREGRNNELSERRYFAHFAIVAPSRTVRVLIRGGYAKTERHVNERNKI
ncbi:hypothetical protein OESDEN_21941 [Oesophagostomum dentatum]|uniref:Uncharacterized protein n=1 Tax=Oesophagostomum dentatum TaxID=61180 RepID=A0A0B1RZB7_OESDE|nr:hypothetical protein OESDEN_21941 [Oesophagostomum dentatum]